MDNGILAVATLLSCALVLGGMAFFAAIVTPTVFQRLGAEEASTYLQALFPRYYLYMAIFAGLSAAAAVPAAPVDAGLMAVVAAGFVFARQVIVPAIERHRDGRNRGEQQATRSFARLHRASVLLNLAQMAVAAVVLARLGTG